MEKKPLSAISDQELEELSKRYAQELMKYKKASPPSSERDQKIPEETLLQKNPETDHSDIPFNREQTPELGQTEAEEIDERTPGQMEPEEEIDERTPGQMEPEEEIDERTPGQMEPEEEIDERTPGQMEWETNLLPPINDFQEGTTIILKGNTIYNNNRITNQLENPGAKPPEVLTDIGKLRVRASAARMALPLAGVSVSIYQIEGGKRTLLWMLRTDVNGLTPMVELPAPDRRLTEKPGNMLPYVVYLVRADFLGYYSMENNNAQIFGGSSSVLPFEMQVLPRIGAPDEEENTEQNREQSERPNKEQNGEPVI